MKYVVTVQYDYDDIKVVTKKDPESAIKQWFIFNSECPTMADLSCNVEDSKILVNWVKNNRDKVEKMLNDKKINKVLNNFFMDQVDKCRPNTRTEFDSVYPFCIG